MPGLIRNDTDLKVLILFIARKLGRPVTLAALTELATGAPGTGALTYFDVASCADSLVKTGHLGLEGGEYAVTEKGVRNGEITEADVPYSVRRHAERAALELRAKLERDELVRTSRTILRRGGYSAEMSLSDGRDEVMLLRVTAASEEQAKKIENAFRERAESVFGAIMRELTE
ncbi:MAG: DUF4364 family protein [Oscillospiraceae bacterium]|jgi:hypothetical protein|nr:DUF4364 family protein [Oscillospiraceae bacterium]